MQPRPIAGTSRLLFPSFRFCIFLLLASSPVRLSKVRFVGPKREKPLACVRGFSGGGTRARRSLGPKLLLALLRFLLHSCQLPIAYCLTYFGCCCESMFIAG